VPIEERSPVEVVSQRAIESEQAQIDVLGVLVYFSDSQRVHVGCRVCEHCLVLMPPSFRTCFSSELASIEYQSNNLLHTGGNRVRWGPSSHKQKQSGLRFGLESPHALWREAPRIMNPEATLRFIRTQVKKGCTPQAPWQGTLCCARPLETLPRLQRLIRRKSRHGHSGLGPRLFLPGNGCAGPRYCPRVGTATGPGTGMWLEGLWQVSNSLTSRSKRASRRRPHLLNLLQLRRACGHGI